MRSQSHSPGYARVTTITNGKDEKKTKAKDILYTRPVESLFQSNNTLSRESKDKQFQGSHISPPLPVAKDNIPYDIVSLPPITKSLIRAAPGFQIESKELLPTTELTENKILQWPILEFKYRNDYSRKDHINFVGINPVHGFITISILKIDAQKLASFEGNKSKDSLKTFYRRDSYERLSRSRSRRNILSDPETEKHRSGGNSSPLKKMNSRKKLRHTEEEQSNVSTKDTIQRRASLGHLIPKIRIKKDRSRETTDDDSTAASPVSDSSDHSTSNEDDLITKKRELTSPHKRKIKRGIKDNTGIRIRSNTISSDPSDLQVVVNITPVFSRERISSICDEVNRSLAKRQTYDTSDIEYRGKSPEYRGKLFTKALIRTPTNDIETSFSVKITKNLKPKIYFKSLKQVQPDMSLFNVKYVSSSDIRDVLLTYEDKISITKYKFGILYCRAGQRFEEDMYRNSCGSADFEEFLSLLGEKVSLRNHSGFNAGLDIDADRDGTHSIYTSFSPKEKEWSEIEENIEIMFHVSTMLGFQEGDIQQTTRKKHIGNDVVVIIYSECTKPFSPIFISSKYNHVFLVVKKAQKESKIKGKTVYKVDVTYREGVGSFSPLLFSSTQFEFGEQFRDWLILKCINGERSSYCTNVFKRTREESRHHLLEQIYKNFT